MRWIRRGIKNLSVLKSPTHEIVVRSLENHRAYALIVLE
jgi:hypothetical protein